MYYATPAPPPVGDLGQEFESGLDLVLKKKHRWAEAGPCRFPPKGEKRNDTIHFFAWVSSGGMGDLTVREAPRRVLNKRHYPLPTHHA